MAEVQIIRICNIWAIGIVGAAILACPANAKRGDSQNLLNKYVAARLAETSNQPDVAASNYAEALKLQPDNSLLAKKTYLQALEIGNFALAVDAINALQLGGQLDAEMPSLLFSEAFVRKDWNAAQSATLELQVLGNFSFLSELLNAWVDTAQSTMPTKALAAVQKNTTAKYYHDEQKVLHQLVLGKDQAALRAIALVVEANEARMASFRIAIARHFLSKNETEIASSILKFKRTGPEAILHREISLGEGKRYARRLDANAGAAFLFQRISSDLASQRAYFLALVTAQNAARLDRSSDYSQLILGRAYNNSGNAEAEIEAFSNIGQNSVYHLVALSSEIGALIDNKHFDRANQRIRDSIKENASAPQLRILEGQVAQSADRLPDAISSFTKAIALGEKADIQTSVLANYWLLLGGAQEQAGLWPEGLNSLKKANELQPNSANILNYLGYAQLERRENIPDAIEAIQKAHQLRSSSPAITDSLGWAYFINGEHMRAVGLLEQARSGQPQDPTINEHLGDAYWTVGREYEARYAWESAKLFADNGDIMRLSEKIDLGLRPDLVSP